MPDNLDAIIARMSEAQKRAVMRGVLPTRQWGTIDALKRQGMVLVRVCHPDENGLSWTPLGLAVRARLKENTDGN